MSTLSAFDVEFKGVSFSRFPGRAALKVEQVGVLFGRRGSSCSLDGLNAFKDTGVCRMEGARKGGGTVPKLSVLKKGQR